nr:hypothetical protein [Tanacetum cinerariifolium]
TSTRSTQDRKISSPGTGLEPRSDKESIEVGITDVIVLVNVYDEEEEEDEIIDEVYELKQREKERMAKFMPRKSFVTLTGHLHEAMADSLPTMVDKHIKEQVEKQVHEQVRNQVLVYVAEGLTLERTLAVRLRYQDDPHDDAHPEGEESAMRQKKSEYETYVSGESSSGHDNEQEQSPSTSESDIVWESRKEILVSPHPRKTKPLVLSCQRDPESPALSLINQDLLYLKKGNSGPKKIVLSLHNFPVVVFDDDGIEERTSRWIFYIRKQKDPGKPKEVIYSNSKIVQVIKAYWELGHEHKFITEIIARRANDYIVLITT